jgi:hypothetical protein
MGLLLSRVSFRATVPISPTLRCKVEASTCDIKGDPNDASGFRAGFHWSTVLNDVAGASPSLNVSEHKLPDSPQEDSAPWLTREILLLSGCKPATREQIIQALPSREDVDRSIRLYFTVLEHTPVSIWSTCQSLRWQDVFINPAPAFPTSLGVPQPGNACGCSQSLWHQLTSFSIGVSGMMPPRRQLLGSVCFTA